MKHPGIVTYGAFGTQASAWVRVERAFVPYAYLLGVPLYPGITIANGGDSYTFVGNNALLDPEVTVSGTAFSFAPGRTKEQAAANMASAINGEFAGYGTMHNCNRPILPFFAMCYGATVVLVATEPGAAGNGLALTKVSGGGDTTGCLTLSGATFTGGTASAITLGGSPMVFGSTSEPSTDPGVSAAIHYRHDGSGTLVGQWWWDDTNLKWILFMGAGTAEIAV